MADKLTLEVRKDNWNETRLVTEPLAAEPAANEVLLKVEGGCVSVSFAGLHKRVTKQ